MAEEDGARMPQLFGVWATLLAASSAIIFLILFVPAVVDAAATFSDVGFQEEVAFGGLTDPTNVEFSKDGRVFVAEKSGLIKVFDGLSDTTPTTFADLRTNVHNFWDRGLLGLALAPNFPTDPYVYVLYTHDAAIGGEAPRWGTADATSDGCANPPGATADGCVVSGRLSVLQADPATNKMTGDEQVLIEDWCQQYPSHSVGDLAFGADGALYVSGGEGASFDWTDYGQGGGSAGSPTPKNPCGDPPSGIGGNQVPPSAEGGSLRSQDLRTGGDPVTLDGTVLRVDPRTGAALPDNPLFSRNDPNSRRIVAYGLRNPFRMTVRPGTSEVWVADVGAIRWEEIDRIANPAGSTAKNFGWPCYEGGGRQEGFDGANLSVCENLYGTTNAAVPYYAYDHYANVVAGEQCGTGPYFSSSIAGLAFYQGGSYPARYDGALFFADYSRDCIWVMEKGTNGLPIASKRSNFVTGAANPVDLEIGAGGDLFYVDFTDGTVRRIRYFEGNRPPVAVAKATPANGPTPLKVAFDGTGSSDPDPNDTLSYEWDLDGDGAYDDSTSSTPSYTYENPGSYKVELRASDGEGASDTDSVVINANNTPPAASIEAPLPTTTWRVGDVIEFSGSATDEEDGMLPASALSWELIMQHCPSDCHEHPVQSYLGVASGSFFGPDHEYPSHLELRLTASDSGGLADTASVRLDPKTVQLNVQTNPSGLTLVVGSDGSPTPFSRAVIVGSKNSISAPSPQTLDGAIYEFSSWSDGGAQSHDVVVSEQSNTHTATYVTASATCTVSGTSASETLTGTSGDDMICGGGGNDTIKGAGGNDTLKGEAGNDKLLGGVGNDALDGGLGTDTASYYASLTAVIASLATNTSTGEGSDTFLNLENLLGSSKPDTLTGSAANNTLTGGGGNDTERGGAGNDKVVGSGGADSLYGEDGADTVNSRDSVNGNDRLDGGAGTDTKVTDTREASIVGFP